MEKYKLSKNSKMFDGVKLYRITAVRDFGSVKNGELGGWVQAENNLSQFGNCWVGDKAQVSGTALVSGNARVCDYAQVSENSRVRGTALVSGNARVSGTALVSGNAWASGDSWLDGSAIATKNVININGLKFNITVCDNLIKVGCHFWLKSEFDSIQYSDVKKYVDLKTYKIIKKVIKLLI